MKKWLWLILLLSIIPVIHAFSVSNVKIADNTVFINQSFLYCSYDWNPDVTNNDTDRSYFNWYVDDILNKSGRINDSSIEINGGWTNSSYRYEDINYTAETYEQSSYSCSSQVDSCNYAVDKTVNKASMVQPVSTEYIYENYSYNQNWNKLDVLQFIVYYEIAGVAAPKSSATINVSFWNYTTAGWSKPLITDINWGGVTSVCEYSGTNGKCSPINISRKDVAPPNKTLRIMSRFTVGGAGSYARYYEAVLLWTNHTIPYLNKSAKDFNLGENITCEIIPNPNNATNGTAINSTTVRIYPLAPTITQSALSFYNQSIIQNVSDTFQLDIDHSYAQNVTYTLTDSFNDSCFNISYQHSTLSVTDTTTNSTNITIYAYDNCSIGNFSEQITFTDNYFGNQTNFSVYLETLTNAPILTVTPLSWSYAGLTTDSFSETFTVSNTGTATGTSCTISSSGSLTPSYSTFNVSIAGSTNVTVSYSSLTAGSYNENLDFTCNGAHTSTDPLQVFVITAPSTTPPSGGGGGGPEEPKNKTAPKIFYQISPDPLVWNFIIKDGQVKTQQFTITNTGLETLIGTIVIPAELKDHFAVSPETFIIPAYAEAQAFTMKYLKPADSGLTEEAFQIQFNKGNIETETQTFTLITSDSFTKTLTKGWIEGMKKKVNLGFIEVAADVVILSLLATIGGLYAAKKLGFLGSRIKKFKNKRSA